MKINFLQWAALACIGTQALASPIADPTATNALHERSSSWDPSAWWNLWWKWFHQQQGNGGKQSCKSPLVRKEWRQLSDAQKKEYISAVQCLASLPAITTAVIGGAITRFDDFQGVHSRQTPNIHWVGHFAVWHRLMMAYYEKALREECGYTGAQPYWDWLIDTESGLNMTQWPIFDPQTGFGGNGPFVEATADQNPLGIEGHLGGGCVQDGPFAQGKFSLALGPTVNYNLSNPHCLTRDFAPSVAETNLVQSVWDEVMAEPDYGAFARRLEALPSWAMKNVHGGGHFGVGGILGTMGDAYNSPGDPLFYLHHTNLDHLFWSWQQEDLSTRLSEVSGPIVPFDYNNTVAGNVTLDFEINLFPLTGNFKLGDLLDTTGTKLCYTYQ
ncbi:hypothetical protein FN846DRAFT_792268 [Sphaerosporella brunnea]|uniref:Tyrosinase copper-binding domain-containing protein n=1 Tax=Sphaerosporella brunnea TaxID=1250544 RepID=A0A5J5F4B1_9PEZI|nr:hypothetical protein FN846DRAFT_792268 [Sphaerosporella brunnea]